MPAPRKPSDRPVAAVCGWICLALGLLAVVLYGAGPHLPPPLSQLWASDDAPRIEIDDETMHELRRAAALLGAGGRLAGLTESAAQLEQAEAIIDGALETYPRLAEAHRLRGLLALARGELEEARGAFERSLELDAKNLSAYLALGASYAEEEDHAAAEKTFRRALEVEPESVAALDNLGQTLWLLGRREEAMEVYRRKIEIQQRAGAVSSPPAAVETPAADSHEATHDAEAHDAEAQDH